MNNAAHSAIAVYVGEGASHSWTWFADVFERERIHDVAFIDEARIGAGELAGFDVLFVSGGDTFAIAAGLGPAGARAIEAFVENGGTYVGACAGAYLLLKSSLAPLHHFNFVQAKIANLTKHLPAPTQRPEKYCTAYGCRYVYHPVRDEVRLRYRGIGCETATALRAPLYGGSAMLYSDDFEVLATYEGFTDKTEYLIDEAIAAETLLGNVAAARKRFGSGWMYLFGPHFEHPDYREANLILIEIIHAATGGRRNGIAAAMTHDSASRKEFREFMAAVSNARIVALSLERSSYQWVIGQKVYDPEKIRVFVEAVWQRAKNAEQQGMYGCFDRNGLRDMTAAAHGVTGLLRALQRRDGGTDGGSASAAEMFRMLRRLAASFTGRYFQALRAPDADRALPQAS